MFLAAKFTPQKKVVQEMSENEDVHDAISKTTGKFFLCFVFNDYVNWN